MSSKKSNSTSKQQTQPQQTLQQTTQSHDLNVHSRRSRSTSTHAAAAAAHESAAEHISHKRRRGQQALSLKQRWKLSRLNCCLAGVTAERRGVQLLLLLHSGKQQSGTLGAPQTAEWSLRDEVVSVFIETLNQLQPNCRKALSTRV